MSTDDDDNGRQVMAMAHMAFSRFHCMKFPAKISEYFDTALIAADSFSSIVFHDLQSLFRAYK